MLSFTTSPRQTTTSGKDATFVVHSTQNATLLSRITDTSTQQPLITKCFMSVTDCRFDIGYAVNRAVVFRPSTKFTGFIDARERSLPLRAECYDVAHPEEIVRSSPFRMYSSDITLPSSPQIFTTLPRERILRQDECEEILLAGGSPITVELGIKTRQETAEQKFSTKGDGVALFFLNAAQYRNVEQLTLTVNGSRIVYTLAPPLPEGRRMAWRSHTGVVEHYTFPIVHSSTRMTDKEWPRHSDDGTRPTCHLTRLVSAYESRPMLEALSEIIAAPQVWTVIDKQYIPVKVITDHTLTHRYGVLSHLEIEIIEPDSLPTL